MSSLVKRLKRFVQSADQKKKDFAVSAAKFLEENPGCFVLLADPDTDVLFAAYQNIMVPVRLTKPDGSRLHIVRNALDYSKVEKSVDQFLLLVDSTLYNIAKERDTKRRKGLGAQARDFVFGAPEKTIEGIKSPLQQKTFAD